ncbi:MAG: GTP cyclohydrolase I FolE [Firmicutes bacterium]|nr:GTP cyclohydrolase I FolE [Bacillota bacterium]
MDTHRIEKAVTEILLALGEDPKREGLVDTPKRVAQMYKEVLSSYDKPDVSFRKAVFFEQTYDNFVLVKDIYFSSVCEHHLLPFFGKAHVAYVPKGCNLGISKFARIVELYASRLQLQERMTSQIVEKIDATLANDGIAVFVEAEHLCMSIRGVKKVGAKTVTSHFTGRFDSEPNLQQLFFYSIKA